VVAGLVFSALGSVCSASEAANLSSTTSNCYATVQQLSATNQKQHDSEIKSPNSDKCQ